MGWNEDKSKERIAARDIDENDIVVADLTKEMDFENLGVYDVRRANAAHLYCDVPNFHDAVADAGADKEKLRRLIRAASVLRRVQGDILRESGVEPIQLQTVRLHCLVYRPYDDEAERGLQAVITAITLSTYVYEVFNKVFEEVRNFRCSTGISSGRSLICNVGLRGERELLSLGSCANLAAKILNGSGTIAITPEVHALLPGELAEHFSSATVRGIEVFRATGLRWTTHPELAEEFGITFNEEGYRKLTEAYRDALPLREIEISGAEVAINPDDLSERNCKRVTSVAIYADLDGFTRYVQEAKDDDDVQRLVRRFHGIRNELHDVMVNDFPGVALQHRGDCVLGMVHLPPEDEKEGRRAERAVELAVGLQSSMKLLNDHYQDFPSIHVAVGEAAGTMLVSRIGKKGARENFCLGICVESAETLQVACGPAEIRISSKVHEVLGDGVLKEQFRKSSDGTFSAIGLTYQELEDKEIVKAARERKLTVEKVTSGPVIMVGSGQEAPAHANTPAWRSK